MDLVTITVTYRDAIQFVNLGKEFLNNKDRKASALTYAISRTIKKLQPHLDAYQELVDEARNKFVKKDKDGVFEYHDTECKQPKFTADDHAKFRKAFKDIQTFAFAFETYLAPVIPSDLELAWYDYFVPFVIADYPQPAEVQQ